MFACSIVPLFRQLDDAISRYPSGGIQDPLPSRREVQKIKGRSRLALGRMATAASVAITAFTRVNGRDWSFPALSHSHSFASLGKVLIIPDMPVSAPNWSIIFPTIALPHVLNDTERGLRLPAC